MTSVADGVLEIHVSDVGTYKACRRLWSYESPLRRNLTPRIPSKHLQLGGNVHYGLNGYYHPENPRTEEILLDTYHHAVAADFVRLQPFYGTAIYNELQEYADLGYGMLEHYHRWAQEHDDFTVLDPEVELRVPLPLVGPLGQPVEYVGAADLLTQSKRDGILLDEFKTASSFPELKALYLEEQLYGYLWAAQSDPRYEGMRPVGMRYTFLRKKLPSLPTELKRGGLSQAKKIDTTFEVYMAAIESLGLDAADYTEILEDLRQRGNTFFFRTIVKPPPSSYATFATSLVSVAAEMISPVTPIYPTGSRFRCGWCSFRLPCIFEHFGFDPEPILRSDFTQRGKRRTYMYGEED